MTTRHFRILPGFATMDDLLDYSERHAIKGAVLDHGPLGDVRGSAEIDRTNDNNEPRKE